MQFAHMCVAQFSLEIGVPSMLDGFNYNFTIVGAYTKIGYRHNKFDYSILGSTASVTNNNAGNEKSLGVTAEYVFAFKKRDWIKIKPGLMVMYTRSKKDRRILNNKTYAIGPSIGVEIKVFKGLSLNSQSAPLYGFRDYDTFQSRNGWASHFPILFSLGLRYELTTK